MQYIIQNERSRICRAFRYVWLAAIPFLLTSCASQPTNRHIRVSDTYMPTPNTISVAVMADMVIIRMQKDQAFCSIADSRLASEYLVEAAASYLRLKGYDVGVAKAPFVGSFKNPARDYEAVPQYEADVQVMKMKPPFYVSPALSEDADRHAEAMHRILEYSVRLQREPSTSGKMDSSAQPLLNVVREHLDTRYAFFLFGQAVSVPLGHSLRTALPQAILTAGITGGGAGGAVYPVSAMDTFVSFVDLENGMVVWSNALRMKQALGDERQKKFYERQWVPKLLFHFPGERAPAPPWWLR